MKSFPRIDGVQLVSYINRRLAVRDIGADLEPAITFEERARR
jgi:hypothetical protein